jgi:hypothetical protein
LGNNRPIVATLIRNPFMRLWLPLLTSAALVLAPPAMSAAPKSPLAAAPVPVAELIRQVDIPYEAFTLPNGLRVLVHTDRKAPVVAVSVWYHVGSKDEPAGKTGFAHLFEHLMFQRVGECARRLLRAARAGRRDRLQRHHLVRSHQLFPDGSRGRR